MNKWTRVDLEQAQLKSQSFYVYFFTPMCGACQLAERMLTIIEQSEEFDKQILAKMDLNYVPNLAKEFRITSVPALAYFEKGKPKSIQYQMHNISTIYEFFQK